jgi:hypothetical protein
MTCPPKRRRREGRVRRAVVGIAACAWLAASCGRGADDTPALSSQAAATASTSAAGGTVPHGDHNPHYGGIVLMNGDLHFEVVLGRDGNHHVYFSDAMRAELPAATASEVTVIITQKSRQPETVVLHIDDSGESWTGRGRPVDDPAATARISYSAYGKPYFIDVPFPR